MVAFFLGIGVVLLLNKYIQSVSVMLFVSIISWFLELGAGVFILRLRKGSPKGEHKTPLWEVFFRGACTFGIFMVALFMADRVPVLAGILVNFPIVSTVVIFSVWFAQG